MKLLILKPDWIAITKNKDIIPDCPENLTIVRNNLHSFELTKHLIRFKQSDYPNLSPDNWINPHSTGGSIHIDSMLKVIEIKDNR